ncbi:hypothetical protein [Peribacillus glennii]|uniref:Uncharacterized protein n=1 Tax=Peribacillus glennii TaxID=2303991 RepID=A0A372L716_9BACI|nr:hypothetical protein [Peribacillus glennii]RFU60443.1 hypothetical protein D0466_21585 [Peribacillus glennii]
MITLTSHNELKETKNAIENLKTSYPVLFEKLVDVVNLTRALQFKYQYMGCLIMDEDPNYYAPNFVQGSVLRLYKKEVQKLKEDLDSPVLKQTFHDFRDTGYANISLLILGMAPEALVGANIIQ